MTIAGAVFVFVAAVIHLFIFFLESVAWSKPSTWRRFGLKTQAEADIVRPMAFNQGFYNVFLAIGAGLGLILLGTGLTQAGLALAIFSCASMVAAAAVLLVSAPKLWRAALIQGVAPLVGAVLLLAAIASGA